MATPVYLTAQEVVDRLAGAIKYKTLENWRFDKRNPGPPYIRVGKNIRYPLAELIEWERSRIYASTHEYASPEVNAARRKLAA